MSNHTEAPATTCTVHGPDCERIHVGDVVQVVASGLGVGQYGTVVAADRERFTVHFPDGVSYPDGTVVADDLVFGEAELEEVR
jgi:hypothetical protein